MQAARLLDLTPAERRLLGEAVVVVGWVRLLLFATTYARTNHLLDFVGSFSMRSRSPAERHDLAERVAWAVRAVSARAPVETTCLPRSVAMRHMLRQRGVPAMLKLGVRREGEAISAHAWIEVDGRRIGEETEPGRHLPLESASSTASRTRGSSASARG